MHFLITQDENLDFVLFFTRFLSRGQLSKECFFNPFTVVKAFIVISIWRVGVFFGHVLVTHDENLDFVLFFTAFLSCGHLSKRCLL